MMNRQALLAIPKTIIAAVLAATPSLAADVYLAAGSATRTMPGGAVVTVWGYSTCSVAFGRCLPPALPGPTLTVPVGDTTLNIHLKNNLDVPTSIVVPGLKANMVPVTSPDPQGRTRVRSFTAATSAGGTTTYSFTNVRPGTYLYHSGTQPQVQVQMGLYGAIKQNAAVGAAYAGVPYSSELVLLFSEIDPALHAAVANGTYGTAAYPSTFDYKPKYYLINGQPYTGQAPLAAGTVGQPTLLRILNAGLRHRTPTLNGASFSLVAEDANQFAFPQKSYGVGVSPLKTFDAVWVPSAAAQYAFFDRSLGLQNDTALGGGFFRKLSVGGASTLVATNDGPYAATEDTPLNVAAPGVLGNDNSGGPAMTAVLVAAPAHGSVALAGNGSFIYTPSANYSGNDQFTYQFTITGGGTSNVATASVAVAGAPDPPVAVADTATTSQGVAVIIDVLANDSDPDPGTVLTVAAVSAGSGGTPVNNGGSVTFTPNAGFTGTASFTYTVSDGTGGTADGNVTITVTPNLPPVAVNDVRGTAANVAVVIPILANDYDPDGTLNPTTVVITFAPNMGGTAVANPAGTITYTPRLNFRGTDLVKYTVRDNLGATSNEASVTVNVVR